jgi:hypothetical protein
VVRAWEAGKFEEELGVLKNCTFVCCEFGFRRFHEAQNG